MTRSMFTRFVVRSLLALALTGAAAAAHAQATAQGKIVDSAGAPVAGATVTVDNTAIKVASEAPQWKGSFTANYANGNWHGLARWSYYGVVMSAQPSFTDVETYGAKSLIDLEAGYQFVNLNLTIGARNLFNVYPDQMQKPYNNNGNTLPWSAVSPFGYDGRYVYARAAMALVR